MSVPYELDLQGCLSALRSGGVILYPTDTVWGLGCDATDETAVQKIYDLKQRAESKSLIVLITEEQDIYRYVAAPDMAVFDFIEEQSRPTTIVFDGAIGFAPNLLAEDGSIALRLVRDP
ncbi:MAG TPA: Sua5/YciO/YrdC/YwlC family protein, partial [Flavisolibacter sp.]